MMQLRHIERNFEGAFSSKCVFDSVPTKKRSKLRSN